MHFAQKEKHTRLSESQEAMQVRYTGYSKHHLKGAGSYDKYSTRNRRRVKLQSPLLFGYLKEK